MSKLNKHDEKLLAGYLSEKTDAEGLNKRTENNGDVLTHLAQHKIIERLLIAKYQMTDAKVFQKEIELRLTHTEQDDFAKKVEKKLKTIQQKKHTNEAANDKHYVRNALLATAVILIVTFFGLFLTQRNSGYDVQNPIELATTGNNLNNNNSEFGHSADKFKQADKQATADTSNVFPTHTDKNSDNKLFKDNPSSIPLTASITQAEPPKEIDLLAGLNADFETGEVAPWKLNHNSVGFIEVRPEAANSGQNGLYINTQAGPAYLIMSPLNLPQGFMQNSKLFKLSFDIFRLNENTNPTGVYARLANHKKGYLTTAYGPWLNDHTAGRWIHFEKYIYGENWPASNTQLEIAFNRPGEEFYIDNVQLKSVVNNKNLLAGRNPDLESGQYGSFIVEKIATGYDNYAQVKTTSEAAITGEYGLYVDTFLGPLAIKLNQYAFAGIQFDAAKSYLFSYDLRLKRGDYSAVHNIPSGWQTAVPGWAPHSYSTTHQEISESGLIKIRVEIPGAEILKKDYFEIGFHVNTKAIFHVDNFEFSEIE
ncbi:hypothetical protein [Catenovulum sediminis]|uniref:Uncharacterized protein n=1 Tax=Catenovulum sediminis TaxID=1740262 RepID=A0ABV1REI7_9ALTE